MPGYLEYMNLCTPAVEPPSQPRPIPELEQHTIKQKVDELLEAYEKLNSLIVAVGDGVKRMSDMKEQVDGLEQRLKFRETLATLNHQLTFTPPSPTRQLQEPRSPLALGGGEYSFH
jgi:hypothetical protein